MKFAIIGGGQLGQQLFNASSCQRMIIDTRPQCPECFAKAELGYSNDLKDAAKCDVVALAVPPAACQSVMDAICPVLPAGTIVLDFPTKWQIPQEMRAAYPQLKLRAMRSQWGNCHWMQGYITLNTALVRCPPRLRDYVALHELVHFLHHDHQAGFYAVMDALMPDWRRRRAELNRYTAAL